MLKILYVSNDVYSNKVCIVYVYSNKIPLEVCSAAVFMIAWTK